MKPKDVGYKALIEKFHLDTMPHWHYSSISNDYSHKVVENSEHIYEIYPKKYAMAPIRPRWERIRELQLSNKY